MPTKCHIHNCSKPSVSNGLCDTHRKRVARHGNVDQTRPKDWGAKEKHPKYKAWCGLRRHHSFSTSQKWLDDFWSFVVETPEKPAGRAKAQRINAGQPWGADNFYWKEPIVELKKREDRAAYMREYSAKMREANPSYHKSAFLRRKYGISIEHYDQMLSAQNGVCAICERAEGNEIRGRVLALAVDHDHATGRVRGLLCSACNTAIGLFGDDEALMAKARSYVLSCKPVGTTDQRPPGAS